MSQPLLSNPVNLATADEPIEILRSARLAGVSHRGMRSGCNQDFLALGQQGENTVMVVCDGISRSQTPELAAQVASRTACGIMLQSLAQHRSPRSSLKAGFRRACEDVSRLPHVRGLDIPPPSTTIVAAIITPELITLAWFGDSRAYWVSPGQSLQLTEDDSWLRKVVESGQMTVEEANQSPKASAITRWLGPEMRDRHPNLREFQIPRQSKNGTDDIGHLILCSDGLWHYLDHPKHLESLIYTNDTLQALPISRGLVDFACNRGGRDNVTVATWSMS